MVFSYRKQKQQQQKTFLFAFLILLMLMCRHWRSMDYCPYFIIASILKTKCWQVPTCPSNDIPGGAVLGALLMVSKVTGGTQSWSYATEQGPQRGSLAGTAGTPGTLPLGTLCSVPGAQLPRPSPPGSLLPQALLTLCFSQ